MRYKSIHVPAECALKFVHVTEQQAALSKGSLHGVGSLSPLVHGIPLDQPVRVAVDACVRIVQTVGRGLSSLRSTLRTKHVGNVLEAILLRPHVIVALFANRLSFPPLLVMIHLLLVEVSSEVRFVVIANVTPSCGGTLNYSRSVTVCASSESTSMIISTISFFCNT